MTLDAFSKALSLAHDNDLEFDNAHPVSEALVEQCEHAIGFRLPESYRKFLLEYGFGGVEDVEYCGLLEENLREEYFLNAYWLTQGIRQKFQLPDELFIVRYLDGTFVCLLLSRMEKGECPVILWDVGEDVQRQMKKPYVLASSFGEYYLEQIEELIED